MDSWHTYPSVFALGHKAIAELLLDPVLVEEKIDGSQFSFGRFEDGLRCRSKGAVLNLLAPDAMFKRAVEIIQGLPLRDGWTYRAEYVMKPKHNTLCYDRVPAKFLILFDINTGHEEYLSRDAKEAEAARLGLEVVPRLFEGVVSDVQLFRDLLATASCLGGQPVEGIVVKNYSRFGADKKVLMGKFVSEAFKEIHGKEWKAKHLNSEGILVRLVGTYQTPARWAKAVQHLLERGELEQTPRDIGKLVVEVPADVEAECADEIKQRLWDWAWPTIRRGLIRGMPEWYKEQLMEHQLVASRTPDAEIPEERETC